MAENKTKPTNKSVASYLAEIEDPVRQADCLIITNMMEELSGREGDWFLAGFSSRKLSLTLYIMGYLEFYTDILKDLGKHKHGKGCLYIKKLSDIDLDVLRTLISTSIERLKKNQ